jgi:hypothetical protein
MDSTLTVALARFAQFAYNPIITMVALILIGLTGVPMNPAMATRVIRAANAGSLVNTVHTSFITFGAVIGSLTIGAGYGLVSTLWLGALLAFLGQFSLLPFMLSKLHTPN